MVQLIENILVYLCILNILSLIIGIFWLLAELMGWKESTVREGLIFTLIYLVTSPAIPILTVVYLFGR